MNEVKQKLRRQLREQRKAVSRAVLQAASEGMTRQMLASALWKNAKTVMLYMALPDEVPMDRLMDAALAAGKQVILPRCENGEILPCRLHDLQELAAGTYGILEPLRENIVDSGRIDLILVPGTAFGARGERLGRGAGYYDRFLNGIHAVTVGICMEEFLLPNLPQEAQDIPVEYVLTEMRLIPSGIGR